jgi:hypothetical protein
MEVEWDAGGRNVALHTLRDGDPFLDGDNDLYVKTNTRADDDRHYCLRIREGWLVKVARDAMVQPIKAKVVVTRPGGT